MEGMAPGVAAGMRTHPRTVRLRNALLSPFTFTIFSSSRASLGRVLVSGIGFRGACEVLMDLPPLVVMAVPLRRISAEPTRTSVSVPATVITPSPCVLVSFVRYTTANTSPKLAASVVTKNTDARMSSFLSILFCFLLSLNTMTASVSSSTLMLPSPFQSNSSTAFAMGRGKLSSFRSHWLSSGSFLLLLGLFLFSGVDALLSGVNLSSVQTGSPASLGLLGFIFLTHELALFTTLSCILMALFIGKRSGNTQRV
mmetsp:Transcript_17725/g.29791  ORF Transcript_17725/g.29791 Transcript_17725/m.29791 type:complete len:255 (-) Transcript_17725:240-1004(-)